MAINITKITSNDLSRKNTSGSNLIGYMRSVLFSVFTLVTILGVWSAQSYWNPEATTNAQQAHASVSAASSFVETLDTKRAKELYNDWRHNNMRALISAKPEKIKQLTGADALKIMGQPELVRKDGSSLSWQYRSQNCVIDLFWVNGASDVSRIPVYHFETRNRGVNKITAKKCIADMIEDNRPVKTASLLSN